MITAFDLENIAIQYNQENNNLDLHLTTIMNCLLERAKAGKFFYELKFDGGMEICKEAILASLRNKGFNCQMLCIGDVNSNRPYMIYW